MHFRQSSRNIEGNSETEGESELFVRESGGEEAKGGERDIEFCLPFFGVDEGCGCGGGGGFGEMLGLDEVVGHSVETRAEGKRVNIKKRILLLCFSGIIIK